MAIEESFMSRARSIETIPIYKVMLNSEVRYGMGWMKDAINSKETEEKFFLYCCKRLDYARMPNYITVIAHAFGISHQTARSRYNAFEVAAMKDLLHKHSKKPDEFLSPIVKKKRTKLKTPATITLMPDSMDATPETARSTPEDEGITAGGE
jgi:hypothetical protein